MGCDSVARHTEYYELLGAQPKFSTQARSGYPLYLTP
jgi:hypothetical protein